ncbi:ATP-dependent DNA helicase [Legionella waltersii]|uniref:ATP-dependent DNA helicase n=1 Tax=Legionella waltersii TaxID=66969 RepID=UPI000731B719|nr:ATP-dependent DNA helicase [Legionella waltersii]
MEEISSLGETCRRMLSEKGRLSTAIPGFISRAPQSELAVAISEIIANKSVLVAEAGTGTGKTFAYLLPCLLSGKKALISTATKTLQDQLFQKDLPMLIKALGLSVRTQNLKGRSNYICQHRVHLHAEEGHFQSPQAAHEVHHVRERMSQMQDGVRSELPEIQEDSTVWPYVTSTSDNCLGAECPHQETCFLVKARKRAMDADLVVINHHLFFADSQLKKEGFGELLPGVDMVVFDEAHQLAEIASNFNGERIGTRQISDLINDIVTEWPIIDLANQPFKALSYKADLLIDQLLNSLTGKEERVAWDDVQRNRTFIETWEQLLSLLDEISACLDDETIQDVPGLKRCKERLVEFEEATLAFNNQSTNKIRWLERFKHTLVLHSTPFDVSESFRQLMKSQSSSFVFTSATLTMAGSFHCFCNSLGLENPHTLLLPSPFNYQKQSLLYFPRGLPDPKDEDYYPALLHRALPIIEACGGRCFFLFTSHRALQLVANQLEKKIKYPLLVQGDEAKPILLARFRELGNAVLLGTSTFWEGVDVKGEALSCVIIDKLPFASPVDPVTKGRMAYLKQKGLSDFDEYSLPNAVIALKQGVGRLIRDESDKGVLMIADPRLVSREYGRTILASLPSIPKTRDEGKVLSFIESLALQ